MNAPETRTARFRRILYCTDFSAGAEIAFDVAVDFARQTPSAELFLLHVIPESEAQFWKSYIYEVDHIDEQAQHDINARIARDYLPRLAPGLTMKSEFRVGQEYSRILEFAREQAVDLIVIGRQGKGALHKAFFGKVAEKVVRNAECAVLVVPGKG